MRRWNHSLNSYFGTLTNACFSRSRRPILDHCIAVVRSGETQVWELFDRHYCVGSKEWKALIRETLVEPAALAEQIRNFGSYLLLESDLA